MGRLPVRPKIDLVFKKIFSENDNILKALISAAINIPIEDIEDMRLGNTEILPQDVVNKFCRLDLKVIMKGKIIDIEIQLSDQGSFQNRALYYWARLFSSSLNKGNDFKSLPEAIVISFVDFDLFGHSNYHSHFVLKETERNELLTDKLSIHFFELSKIPKEIDHNNRIEPWLKLIGAETYEELYELDKVDNSEIKEALSYVKNLNSDDKFKERLDMYEDAVLNEISALNHARFEGMEQGVEKGIKEMVNAMRKRGMSEEEINEIIKLSDKK